MVGKQSGNSFLGWLGRQVGHVRKAIQTNPAGPKTVYREQTTEEKSLPGNPNVKLRRTTIDEVIQQPEKDNRA